MKTDICFLISAYPDFCPCCGKDLRVADQKSRSFIWQDFSAGCSFSCECGAQYQKLTSKMEDKVASELDSYWRKQ